MNDVTGSRTDEMTLDVSQAKKHATLSDCLPHAARALKAYGVRIVRAEYERRGMHIIAMGEEQGTISLRAAAMICIELDQHLTVILRRRYPAHFEGDGSKGFFEWDLRTDSLKHEHTRIHHGL